MKQASEPPQTKAVSTCFQFGAIRDPDLEAKIDFSHFPPSNQRHSSVELRRVAYGAEILIIGDDELDVDFFADATDLQLLIRWGAGTDNVDFEAAGIAGVRVLNTPGLFGEDVADLAVAHALALVRNLRLNHSAILSEKWDKLTTRSFRELQFGIVGFGAAGREIAKILNGFGLTPKCYDPLVDKSSGSNVLFVSSLSNLLSQSNVLFLNAPLNRETHKMIGPSEVMQMPSPRYVVNTARGELIDEKGLIQLVLEGTLDGLGLDVFEVEPPVRFGKFGSQANFSLTCHNASNTRMSIERANSRVEQIIRDFVANGV